MGCKFLKKNLNAPRLSEQPIDTTTVSRKIRTRLDLLSIPQSGVKNVKTFRRDHRLQIPNLFMAFKRVPLLW